ncbi:MAG: hypothetical protein ACRELS_14515 [Candidatus Rokuibacteriota bacterium]
MTAVPDRVRTSVKAAVWSVLALFLLVVLPTVAFVGAECFSLGVQPSARTLEIQQAAAGLTHYYRDEAATYLTLPEWYIVYSTEEYGAFIGALPPSRFPYFRAVRQYWRYYGRVCRVTKSTYPFDPGVHLMLGVIGVSFTAENVVRGGYESTLGRLSEWIGGYRTEEDAFARRTAREYATFMRTVPWYEFPFRKRLAALWRETPLWGSNPVRKWERRVALTAEYGTKAVYAWLIRAATGTVYAPEDQTIFVRVEDAADSIFADTRIVNVRSTGSHAWIVRIPRYEAFTEIVVGLARRGVRFRDIAGNDEILVTAIAPRDWRYTLPRGRLLFSERILTDRALKRVAVWAPVESLQMILAGLEDGGARVEHVHDY